MADRHAGSEEISRLLVDCPAELCDLVLDVREFVLETVPEVTEAIKFKALCYYRHGERYGAIGGNVCMIEPHVDCLRLSFIHGAHFSDPLSLLRGNGKAKRYVEIRSEVDFQRKGIRELLLAAVAHIPGSVTN